MFHDVRYALRLLRQSPLFTAAVVLTLALGVGATTATFSVVNAVMLRPLPFAHPEGLVQIAEKNDTLHLPTFGVSVLNYLSWKEQARAVEQMGAIGFATFNMSGRGDPEQYTGSTITPSLMPLLGLNPVLGRGFANGEDRPGAARVVIISEALWRRRFGADPRLVGQPVTLNGIAHTIVGIAPAALTVMTNGEIWTPLTIDPPHEMRLNHVIFVVGRLRAGVSLRQAQIEMDTIAARVGQQYPEVKDWGIHMLSFSEAFVSPQLRTALVILLGAVGFVLLIVCANVANLLLARAAARQREIAVRTALGASRARLIRQLLAESLVLALAGGSAGLLSAVWAVHALERALPPNLLPVPGIGIDRTVLCFALVTTIATGMLFGLAPAWHGVKADLTTALKETARASAGSTRPWLRRGLAATQLAMATLLLVGAGLLLQSLVHLQHVQLGFDPGHVLSFQVAVPQTRYDAPRSAAFYRDLLASVRALPDVQDAAVSSGIPFGAGNYTTSPYVTTGPSVLPPGTPVPVDWRLVSPGFFKTLRIPLLRGRDFSDNDVPGSPSVMIVSRATALTFWGDQDPIGRVVKRVADSREFTVVGVVGDVRSSSLSRESPALYYASVGRVWPLMDIVVRTGSDPAALLNGVRATVRRLDPELPIANVRPMTEWVATSAAQPRLNALLLGVFACVALVVAAIGVYGVLAYSVTQRTREIGLRMALGADQPGVIRLIVGEGMTTAAIGIAVGIATAAAVSRTLAALVFGLSVHDPATFLAVAGVLIAVALAACALPARRASRIDPMIALRAD